MATTGGEPSGAHVSELLNTSGNRALRHFSLNQKTVESWSVPQVVDACTRRGIPAIGLWRESVAAYGLERTARLVSAAELRVSSLCRGGFVTSSDPTTWRSALNDNKAAIEEASILNAACLVLVVGGLPAGSKDLPAARKRVHQALTVLVGHAEAHGVRLALEPLHPMFCSDRAVLSTLGQALDLAEEFSSETVGVVIDAYHVWWDPQLQEQVDRGAARIAAVQVSDWILPLAPDPLMSRGMMGDGCIDLTSLVQLIRRVGYSGDVEVEIFNEQIWAANVDDVLDQSIRTYLEHVRGE